MKSTMSANNEFKFPQLLRTNRTIVVHYAVLNTTEGLDINAFG